MLHSLTLSSMSFFRSPTFQKYSVPVAAFYRARGVPPTTHTSFSFHQTLFLYAIRHMLKEIRNEPFEAVTISIKDRHLLE